MEKKDTKVYDERQTEVSEWKRYHTSKYTKELRLEAVRLVTEGGLSSGEVATRPSHYPNPPWRIGVRAFRAGKLENIGSTHRPLTEVEVELARVKRELALMRMERDILKKAAAYFAKESLHGTR